VNQSCYVTIADRAYLPHAYVLLASLSAVGAREPVFMVTEGWTSQEINDLQRYADGAGLSLSLINGQTIDRAGLSLHHQYSQAVWLKLSLGQLLPQWVRRAIYLDADLLLLASVSSLFGISLHGRALAGVPDVDESSALAKQKLGAPPDMTYFNSGLLVMDMDRFRSQKIGERALAFALANPDRLMLVDQCALNGAVNDEFQPIGRQWNFLAAWDFPVDWSPPRVVHFAGIKPLDDPTVPGARLYFEYLNQTPAAMPIDRIATLRDESLVAKRLRRRTLRERAKHARRRLFAALGSQPYRTRLAAIAAEEQSIIEHRRNLAMNRERLNAVHASLFPNSPLCEIL
jgi:lipopolysaccharide biosynthesis glycosyltransferase